MKWSDVVYGEFVGGRGALGLLALRIVAGLGFMFHGWGKIRNPMGWMGPDAGTPGFFQALAGCADLREEERIIIESLVIRWGAAAATRGRHVPWLGGPRGSCCAACRPSNHALRSADHPLNLPTGNHGDSNEEGERVSPLAPVLT